MPSAHIVLIEGLLAVVLVELVIGRYSPWPNYKPSDVVNWLTSVAAEQVRGIVFWLCYVLDVTRWLKFLPLEEFANVMKSLIELLASPIVGAGAGIMDYIVSPFSQMLVERYGAAIARRGLVVLLLCLVALVVVAILGLLDYYEVIDMKSTWKKIKDFMLEVNAQVQEQRLKKLQRQQDLIESQRVRDYFKDVLPRPYNTRRRKTAEGTTDHLS